jgi:hypothetical protein
MNIKLIIAGVIFLILIVAFGRNPIEEQRQAREAAKVGKDPLVESIHEYNTKTGEFAPSLLRGAKKGLLPEATVKPAAPAQSLPIQTNPYAQPTPKPADKSAATPPQPETYYPPPPLPSGR